MIITDNFVFIHYPKTGGLFVAEVLKNIHGKKAQLGKPQYFQELMLPNLKRINSSNVHNPHGTYEQIPIEHRTKQLISCIRNPFSWYVSSYEYGAWRTRGQENLESVRRQFPAFPELNFHEFLSFINGLDMINRTHYDRLKEDIGVITYSFIQFFFTNPGKAIEHLDETCMDPEKFARGMPNKIIFLHTENLNEELYQTLKRFGYQQRDIAFIEDEKKVNVTSRRKAGWTEYYDPESFNYVKHKERFILRLFPEYDRNFLLKSEDR